MANYVSVAGTDAEGQVLFSEIRTGAVIVSFKLELF